MRQYEEQHPALRQGLGLSPTRRPDSWLAAVARQLGRPGHGRRRPGALASCQRGTRAWVTRRHETFVVQKHWASSLHYDFRLELDGTMKSWAVPKGPSLETSVKPMAVQVEDHPLAYADFEGTVPAKQYGAGKVIMWDAGIWLPLHNPQQGVRDSNLKFELHGHKLRGRRRGSVVAI